MKGLERNKRSFHYCLYEGKVPILDEAGYETGETRIKYSEPVELRAHISATSGEAQLNVFGNLDALDRVIAIDDINCPIDTNSILFIDNLPKFDSDNNPLNDYIVKEIGKSFNSIAIAITKVIKS